MGYKPAVRVTIWVSVLLLISMLPVFSQQSARPSVSSHLILMGFTLGKSTISDVQKKLGASQVGRCSGEEEASKEICYVLRGPQHNRVYFEAGVSGGWSQLDEFRVVSGSEQPTCQLECMSIAIGSDVQTSGGLRLGLGRSEVLNLLGPPNSTSGNKLTFQWQSRKPMTKEELRKSGQNPVTYPFWNVVDTINILLKDSRVVAFDVGHSVTN